MSKKTIARYIKEIDKWRDRLANILTEKGLPSDESEKLNDLVPRVRQISGGRTVGGIAMPIDHIVLQAWIGKSDVLSVDSVSTISMINVDSSDVPTGLVRYMNNIQAVRTYLQANQTLLFKAVIGNLSDVASVSNPNYFYGCPNLVGVTLSQFVTTLGSQAFYGCIGLKSITIPSSVTSIASNAFTGCSNLTTITVNKAQGSISGAPWGATNATVVWTG